jgi:hypothetical protein
LKNFVDASSKALKSPKFFKEVEAVIVNKMRVVVLFP